MLANYRDLPGVLRGTRSRDPPERIKRLEILVCDRTRAGFWPFAMDNLWMSCA